MTNPEHKKDRCHIKILFYLAFLLLGVCIGLLTAWGFHRENGVPKPDAAGTNSHTFEADTHTTGTDAVGTQAPGAESIDLIVDYPFSYGLENWQLVLHKESAENGSDRVHSEREFRLYNGDGQLVQTYDYSSHLPELELFFDEQTGQGCGIIYMYDHNYTLEQVTRCRGFSFVQTPPGKWEPEDTFSTLSIHGSDARADNVSGYREIYEYTDDGKLSLFEARGIIADYGESEKKEESTLLSMSYVYRSDGTLYHKQYYHHPIQFGSYLGSQSCYYDEQGRIVCKYCYTTSGSIYYYYVYRDNREEPAYCLTLDSYGGAWPKMISYDN